MSSINFNESAMVALNTLKSINRGLADVQDQISTGKKIATARDNAAIWSISTVMESDVMAFKTITDSLNLGSSTVNVARSAAEQVTALLQETKALIVSAQEENVDRSSIQRDVDALKDQIGSIVDSAQFNGLNLLKGGDDVSLLSSLNRDNANVVTATEITVGRADLRQAEATAGTTAITTGNAGFAAVSGATVAADADGTVTFTGGDIEAGDTFNLTIGGVAAQYVASGSDTLNDVVTGLTTAFNAKNALEGTPQNVTLTANTVADPSATNVTITVGNDNANGGAAISLAASSASGGVAGGKLEGLIALDVTTDDGADLALAEIDGMIQSAIDATAAFGSAQNRIDIQNDFVSSLIQSLEAGVSALTDANLEEASARLQSLQVQQQLNIQALTIANQSPQAILALFR